MIKVKNHKRVRKNGVAVVRSHSRRAQTSSKSITFGADGSTTIGDKPKFADHGERMAWVRTHLKKSKKKALPPGKVDRLHKAAATKRAKTKIGKKH